jgi:hypothetical protein
MAMVLAVVAMRAEIETAVPANAAEQIVMAKAAGAD